MWWRCNEDKNVADLSIGSVADAFLESFVCLGEGHFGVLSAIDHHIFAVGAFCIAAFCIYEMAAKI